MCALVLRGQLLADEFADDRTDGFAGRVADHIAINLPNELWSNNISHKSAKCL